MTVLNYAKNKTLLILGGSTAGSIGQILIGTGSSTVTASDTELVTPLDRQTVTNITFPLSQKTTWQFDWNSSEISGAQLSEFGILASGGGLTGSLWSRIGIPSLTFDGTNELRIEETWEIF